MRSRLFCLTALPLVVFMGCQKTPKTPEDSPALQHHKRAYTLIEKGDATAAEEEWRTAIGLDPKFAPAYFALADLYELSGNPARAADAIAPLRTADPKALHVECRRADLYFQADGYEIVILLTADALRREPDCPQAHLMRGIILSAAGKKDEALTELRLAHEKVPREEKFIFPLAQALGEAGKTDEALALVRPLSSTSKAAMRTRYLLGMLLARRGKPEDRAEAKKVLEEALAASKNYAPAQAELGMLLAQEKTPGAPLKARQLMEAALAAGYTSPELAAALAALLERTKSPDATAARRLAREGAAITERLQKARAHYLDSPDDTDNNLALAELEAQRGDTPDALALTQQALHKDPNNAKALQLQRFLTSQQPKTR